MKNDRKQNIIESGIFPQVISHLFPEAKPSGTDQVLVCCPFHQDKNPSLSVNTTLGLYKCFACGEQGNGFDLWMKVKAVDFKTALDEIEVLAGIDRKKTGTVKQFPQVVAVYSYFDDEGCLRYWKKRFEPGFEEGRSKSFAFYHGKGGKEAKGRGGEPVLYNLQRIAKAPPGEPLFVLEGEAKVDVFTAWDLYATCLDSGSQSGKGTSWRDDFQQYFKDKDVYILPDNDKPGETYAASIAGRIFKIASSVKILRLPGLPPKGDILDWIKMKGASIE